MTGTGGNTAHATSVWFTVTAAPTLFAWKPFSDLAANTQQILISGHFSGARPDTMSYQVDGGAAASAEPILWENFCGRSTSSPPVRVKGGTHTVTITGTGPNTAHATTPPFYVAPQVFAPGATSVPTAAFIGVNLIAITWTAPVTGSPPIGYAVQYEAAGAG